VLSKNLHVVPPQALLEKWDEPLNWCPVAPLFADGVLELRLWPAESVRG
jgi:hypothetical protein